MDGRTASDSDNRYTLISAKNDKMLWTVKLAYVLTGEWI